MKKTLCLLFALLLFLCANAQQKGGFFSFDKKQKTIEIDITKISRIEHRMHIIYALSVDARFEVAASGRDGRFIVNADESNEKSDLYGSFLEFIDEENTFYNSLTKEELGDMFHEWKSALPDDFTASIMMDMYVKSRENNLCSTADPFCTDNGAYVFPAGVNAGSGETGPNYDCLSTQPNPAWYYMRIGTPGSINIYMYSTPSVDIDFCCWGPFDDPITPCPYELTIDKKVSCSYSANATETCVIPSTAQTGEFYILVITNYSNQTCNITFSKTAGAGTTDCSIMPPLVEDDGPYCVGSTINLSGNAQSGATYTWSGPGGWTAQGANVSRPDCTFDMGGEYICTIALNGQTNSATIDVTVYALPISDFNATAVCDGETTQFNNTSTTNPPGQEITNYQWDFGDDETSTLQSPTHTYSGPGEYNVTLTTATGGGKCTNTISKTVIVYEIPVADAGPDGQVNFHNAATLTAAPVAGASYLWQPAEKINGNPAAQSVQTVPLDETTIFTVTVTKNGCSDQDETMIAVGDAMTASVHIDDDEICEGNSTTVTATAMGGNGSYTYSWTCTRPATISNPNASSTEVHPNEAGEYIFTCDINDGQTSMRKQVTLNVNPAQDDTYTLSVCPNELPYILELPDGSTMEFNEPTGADGWHQTIPNQFGCLVNVSLYLSVNDIVQNTFTIETCDEPYVFIENGVVIKVLEQTGVFDTVYPYGDCLKQVTIDFTRHDAYNDNYAGEYVSDNYPEHHCNSYTWINGMTYDSTGDYPWTFESVDGCDSIVTLHLDDGNFSFTVEGDVPTETLDTCKNNDGYYLWGDELTGKIIYYGDTINGTVYENLFTGASVNGCDSIGYLNIRLFSKPHVNESLGGDNLVVPGLGFMPYIYQYTIEGLYGAGIESDYPAEFQWEIYSYYDTPNRLHPEISGNYESSWFLNTEGSGENTVLVYVNEEGNALLKCSITTHCGTISTEKFIYTEGWDDGYSTEDLDYDKMVNIFPNPSKGELYIGYSELLSTTPLTIRIYSCDGTMIDMIYSTIGGTVTEYSTSMLPDGLYFVNISGRDFSTTRKFVMIR